MPQKCISGHFWYILRSFGTHLRSFWCIYRGQKAPNGPPGIWPGGQSAPDYHRASKFYPDCERVGRCLTICTVFGLLAQQLHHVVQHVFTVPMVYSMLGYEAGNAEKIVSLSQFYPDCEQVRRCLAICTVFSFLAQQLHHVVEHVFAVTIVYRML